jgi:hypothetical protein
MSFLVLFMNLSARKSRKEKARNGTIKAIMKVGKNILVATEEKRLRWFGHVERMPGNRLSLNILEWEPDGTRRRGKTQREMDRWNKTEYDKPWTEKRGY